MSTAPASRYAEDFLAPFVADLQQFTSGLKASEDLASFLASSQNSVDEKKQLLREVFGKSMDAFSLSLLLLAVEQGSIGQVAELQALLAELLHRWRDLLAVRITTALPLTATEEQNLRTMLQERYGKEVLLEKVVDESLIGGAVLKIGDKLYDGSIKSQLASLEKDLLQSS